MGFSVISSKTTRIVALVLRVLTAVVLFASLLILVTNSQEYILYKKNKVLRFYDKIGYRYAAVIILLGIAHSIYQTVCVVVRMRKGNEGNVLFDFYAEKVMSNLLVTGAVAGFVTTGEILNMVAQQPNGQDRVWQYQTFASLANSSSGLILLCCIFSSMLSVLSSYGLSGDYDD